MPSSPLKPPRVFEAYADTGGRWRWRSKAPNGRIAAVSGESFASRKNAIRAARKEASLIPGALLKNADA